MIEKHHIKRNVETLIYYGLQNHQWYRYNYIKKKYLERLKKEFFLFIEHKWTQDN